MQTKIWKMRIGVLGSSLALASLLLVAGCHKDSQNAQQQPQPGQQTTDANGNPQQYPQAQGNGNQAAYNGSGGGTGNTAATQGQTSVPPSAAPGRNGYPAPNAPAPAPAPVTVASGKVVKVRLDQTINVKTTHAGERFTGTVVSPVDGSTGVAIPEGSRVDGEIVAAHKRGHFKGSSILQLTLTGVEVDGHHYALETRTVTRTKKGKGKRTAAWIGGGSGLGMLVGGVATGGVGLVVGGLAGAGGGTAVAGLTGNKDIVYPAESVVSFRLASPVELRP